MRLVVLCLLLAGCHSARPDPDKPPIIVTQPCASKRPDPVKPLRDQIADWGALTPRQKAAQVSAQALRHANYGDALSAATSACPEVK